MSAVVRVHTAQPDMQEVELSPIAGTVAPAPAPSPQPGAEAAAAATSSAAASVAASVGGPVAAAGQPVQEPSPIQPGAAPVEHVAPAAYLEFLRKFRSVWREQPDLYISWENLSYSVKVPKTDTKVPTLVSGIAHALAKPVKAVAAALSGGEHEKSYNILPALAPSSGVIRPGTMTLVLAPPGHGKSTLLKALSGRLSHDSSLKGSVRFNNRTEKENLAHGVHVSRLAAFVGQSDLLFPVLTVDETLRFAANSSLPDPRLLLSDSSLSPEDRAMVEELIALDPQRSDMLIKLLGLEECKQTIVGNDLLRGVSGGQRKRVSLGEMLLSNARAFMLDEVSTGLDAAVTLHIFSALKQACKVNNSSVVVALLQPTPETYGLFDDILLLRDGQTVFHGPRDEVPKWLWEVAGLEVPSGVDEAGFIVDYLSDPRLMYENAAKAHEAMLGEKAEHSSVHQPEGLNGQQQQLQVQAPAALDLQGRESQRATLSGPVHTPTHVKIHLSPEGENSRSEGDEHRGNHAAVPQEREQQQGLLAPPAPAAAQSSVVSAEVDPRQKQLRGAMSSSSVVQYHSTIQGTPVLTSHELHARYRSSMWAAQGNTEMELAKSKAVPLDPKGWNAYTKAQYAQRFPHNAAHHTSLNMSRQFKLTARNKTMVPPRLVQSVMMGLIFGTLFISLPKEKFGDRMGLLLYVIMAGAFSNLTELPVASEARNVVSKQIDAGFFPSISYSLSVAIMHIPLTVIECFIFGSLMYWLPGFHASAGNYFFFMLVLVINSNALSVFFRCISYLAKNPDIARQMDMPFIVCFIVFGGFLITYDKIPRWLLFIFYISPFSWGVRSLAQNEFRSSEYDSVSDPATGIRDGDEYLAAFGVFLEHVWLWMGVVYLAGFYVVFLLVNAWLLHRIKPITPQGTRKAMVETKHAPIAETTPPLTQQNGATNGTNGSAVEPAASPDSVIRVASKPVARRLGGNKASFQLSALPFTPVTLAWRHINYSVEVGTGKEKHSRQLLNDISGFAAPGRMTALMGSSGAGKTTLMDVVAGRKTVGTISGEILVNGYPKEKASFEKLTGYVEQNDVHIGTATVREALLFSARLRLPLSVSPEAREVFVDEVMALVGLSGIANRLIGDAALPGLSQGQLKLVTIAVELVANPSVIFLDEPTSGLDAPSAARVMKAVRRIAGTGRTVLCTIHQPSEALFLMFDRLLLLKSGGRDVYFSEIGRKGAKLVSYFEEASDYKELLPRGSTTILPNGKKKVQLRISPANWMLDVIGAAGQSENIADYAAIWRKSSLYNSKTLQEIEDASTPAKGSAPLVLTESYASNLTRYSMVQYRSFVSHWRNAPMNLTRFLLMIVFSIVLGIVYLNIDTSDFGGVSSQLSVIFLAMSFPSSICAGSALPTFFRQRAVYYRETTIGLYGPTIFHISNFMVELPYLIVCIFIFLTPFYFMVGFDIGARQYFAFYLMSFLMCICYSSLSALWLALFPNQIAANIANGFLMNLFFMFGGLFIKPSSIPIGWQWFHYVDPVPKAFIPVALNQFFCDVNAVGNTCPQIKPSPTEPLTYTYNYLRHLLQQDAGDYSKMVGYLILEIVVIRLFVAIALKKVSHIKR